MYNASPLLIFMIVTRAAVLDDQPYCALRYRRLCQGKGQHVACQFPYVGPSSMCRNYTEIKFTSDLRNFITHDINRRRQRIASGSERVRGGAYLPQPEVMMLVGWDRELAFLAQKLANQCNFVHDDCRATVRYPYSGQSVGEVRWRRFSGSQELGAQRAIRRVFDAWWGERRRVMPKQLTAPFKLTPRGMVWGHFSQLAVWTLRAVGCGAALHGADYTRLLLVCDFSHTNMLGQRTLKPGRIIPCPMYTERRSRSAFPLLCGPIKRTTPEEKKETIDDMYKEYEEVESTSNQINEEDTIHMTALLSTEKRLTTTEVTTKNWNRGFDNYRDIAISDQMREPKTTKVTKAYYSVAKTQKATRRRILDKLERELDMRKTVLRPMIFKKLGNWETRIPFLERTRNSKKIMKGEKDLNIPRNQKNNKDLSGIYSNREFIEEKILEDRYRGKERIQGVNTRNKQKVKGVHRFEGAQNEMASKVKSEKVYDEELSGIYKHKKNDPKKMLNIRFNQETDDKEPSRIYQHKEINDDKMADIHREVESGHKLGINGHQNYKGYEEDLARIQNHKEKIMKIYTNQRGNEEGIQRNRNDMLSEISAPENDRNHEYNSDKRLKINNEDADSGIERKSFMFDEATRPVHYRAFVTDDDHELYHGSSLRHKWKQTRMRPQRPGANALMSKIPEKNIYKSSSVSLMLDNEDLDQLFKDTGFNMHWRKQGL